MPDPVNIQFFAAIGIKDFNYANHSSICPNRFYFQSEVSSVCVHSDAFTDSWLSIFDGGRTAPSHSPLMRYVTYDAGYFFRCARQTADFVASGSIGADPCGNYFQQAALPALEALKAREASSTLAG